MDNIEPRQRGGAWRSLHLICYIPKRFFNLVLFYKSYEFLNIFIIFVGLIHSNLHTTHTIIDNHMVSSQKLFSLMSSIE